MIKGSAPPHRFDAFLSSITSPHHSKVYVKITPIELRFHTVQIDFVSREYENFHDLLPTKNTRNIRAIQKRFGRLFLHPTIDIIKPDDVIFFQIRPTLYLYNIK